MTAEASLPLYAIVFNAASKLLSKPEAVVNGVLGCLFRAKSDPEGGVASERGVFLLHPCDIFNLVAELREIVLLANLLDTVFFLAHLNLFS